MEKLPADSETVAIVERIAKFPTSSELIHLEARQSAKSVAASLSNISIANLAKAYKVYLRDVSNNGALDRLAGLNRMLFELTDKETLPLVIHDGNVVDSDQINTVLSMPPLQKLLMYGETRKRRKF
ncbi:MAG: hypothetical protein ABL949_16590 [Fimbriimonadaceae bacterium]